MPFPSQSGTQTKPFRPAPEDSMSTADRYHKAFPVTWEQLHRDAKALSWRLLEKGPFTGIIAIARGGLVPAAIIARELDIRLIETLCISSYQWKEQTSQLTVLKAVEGTGKGWLIIDDLVDTGGTARVVREMLPDAHFATVYAKPEGRPLVDTYVTEVSQDTWILFPWDSEVQYVVPLVNQKQDA